MADGGKCLAKNIWFQKNMEFSMTLGTFMSSHCDEGEIYGSFSTLCYLNRLINRSNETVCL